MELSDQLLKEYGFVTASKYRTKVMKTLDEEPKIPSVIAKDANISQNHISAILKPLKEHKLVECINPEAKKGRLYRLTDKGVNIANNLK